MIPEFFAALGFSDVLALGESHVFWHFHGRYDGKEVFIKMAKNPEVLDSLRREITYAELMTSFGLPETVSVLRGELRTDGELPFCVFPYVQGPWLGSQRPDRLNYNPGAWLEHALADLERKHALVTPEAAAKVYGPDRYSPVEHMHKGLASEAKPHIGKTLTQEEYDGVHAWAATKSDLPLRFQHNDVMPPNMCWNGRSGVMLVDAQFSGFRMKWWDIAYFYVQTYTFFRSPVLANRVLRFMLNAFAGDGIAKEIVVPLRYRSTLNLAMASGEAGRLARQLWERTQTEDPEKILTA